MNLLRNSLPLFELKRLLIIAIGFCFFLSCKKDEIKSPPTDGLVANISLDGTAVDDVNNITAINHHALWFTDRHGKQNHALYFSRNDFAYLDFGDASSYSFPQNIFTISCWLMVNDTTQPITILSKRTPVGPFEYSWDNHFNKSIFNFDNWISSGAMTVYGTDPLDASIPIVLNQWQNIVVVADGIVLRTYLNGELMSGVDSIKAGNSFSDTDAPLQIGNGGGYGKSYFFDGAIDDVLIYDRVLGADEIKTLAEL